MAIDARRRAWIGAGLGSLAFLVLPLSGNANGVRIAVRANKFSFTPNELRIRRGQPITLMLSTEDFVHGFSVPDFDIRIDLVPGKTVELTFTPNRAGTFVLLCDNFCGDGHDKMAGMLIVTP